MTGLMRVLFYTTAVVVAYSIVVQRLLPFLRQLVFEVVGILRVLLYMTVLVVASCIIVRWLLPPLLKSTLAIIDHCVAFLASCLLLPEYWLSTAARRRSGYPPRLAYEYGDAITGLCRMLHIVLHRAAHGVTVAAQKVPVPCVAVLTAGIYLAGQFQ
jgi:hypothetical protein